MIIKDLQRQFNSYGFLIAIVFFISCSNNNNPEKQVNVLSIPKVEIMFSELELAASKGLYLFKEKPFTGIAIKNYANGNTAEKNRFCKR